MFLVSFFCGCLPTWIASSSNGIGNISLYGAGLLVGVSLVVIIPEGMKALYMNSFSKLQSTLPGSFNINSVEDTAFSKLGYELMEKPGDNLLEVHQIVGLCLIVGFLFMTIVERVFHMWKEKTESKLVPC
jgi:zinc transporter 9